MKDENTKGGDEGGQPQTSPKSRSTPLHLNHTAPTSPHLNHTAPLEHPTNQPRPGAVALCISGVPRSLVISRVVDNIYKAFDGLRKVGRLDVFMYLTVQNLSVVDYALQRLQPVKVGTTTQMIAGAHRTVGYKTDNLPDMVPPHVKEENSQCFNHAYMTFNAVKKCYQLVEEYEKAHRVSYTWHVRARTDVVYGQQLTQRVLDRLNKGTVYSSPWIPSVVSDRFAIVPASIAQDFHYVLNSFEEWRASNGCQTAMRKQLCSARWRFSECRLRVWLELKGHRSLKAILIGARVVRCQDPQCKKARLETPPQPLSKLKMPDRAVPTLKKIKSA